ncbi:MAG: DUF423 domain-containing protein [Nevskiales bacterium]|nr:DUF423 domain-containing protein [Nevskiales bacterium]
MDRLFLLFGSGLALLGVGLGAFGAHALRSRVSADLLAVWRTAVEYQFYHAFALLALGMLLRQLGSSALMHAAGWCFFAGTLLFSGSLYTLVLSGVRGFGAVTPIGGVLFLVGWALLIVALLRRA